MISNLGRWYEKLYRFEHCFSSRLKFACINRPLRISLVFACNIILNKGCHDSTQKATLVQMHGNQKEHWGLPVMAHLALMCQQPNQWSPGSPICKTCFLITEFGLEISKSSVLYQPHSGQSSTAPMGKGFDARIECSPIFWFLTEWGWGWMGRAVGSMSYTQTRHRTSRNSMDGVWWDVKYMQISVHYSTEENVLKPLDSFRGLRNNAYLITRFYHCV